MNFLVNIKLAEVMGGLYKVARSLLESVSSNDRIAMLQINLEKAFDRVQHDVLHNILAHAGVGKINFTGN